MSPSGDDVLDVAIVGAGHAGLCVAGALRRRGMEATMFDGADRIGDTWRARYDGLHLNTERSVSTIPDTDVADGVGRWPTRTEWADYIESAAAQLEVDRRHEVVERIEQRRQRWAVVTGSATHLARSIVVATGRNRVPQIPSWPGLEETPIQVQHSTAYRNPAPYAGRRVFVVGAGNSGSEIAHLLATAGVDVALSMRTRPVWARRELFGSNLSEFARMGRRLPSWMVDLSGRMMQPLLFGRMRPYGLGPPQRKLSRVSEASGATVDSGFIDDVKSGRIRLVAAVDRFEGRDVVLNDGLRVEADIVIAATGTHPGLSSLLPADALAGEWPAIGEAPFEQLPGLFTAGLNPAKLTAFHPDFIDEAEQIANGIVSRRSPG